MKLAPLIVAGLAGACAPGGDSQAQGRNATSPPAPTPADAPRLVFPIDCKVGVSCEVQNYVDRDPGPEAKDYSCGSNTYDGHGGVDIRIPDLAAQGRGVNVLAAAAGRVARLRDGVADISVRAVAPAAVDGQECGNGIVIDHGGGWETQYCHLAKGSLKVKVGEVVASGQPIAQIGLSGNTEYPHLHLTVRSNGMTVEPFAPQLAEGACSSRAEGSGLWTAAAAKAMAYKPGAVLNVGFAAAPVTMEAIEAGGIAPPTSRSPMLIAYARAINLRAGDVQELVIRGPDGAILAQGSQKPLDRAKAQYMSFVGKRGDAWASGDYVATFTVRREGEAVISQEFKLRL